MNVHSDGMVKDYFHMLKPLTDMDEKNIWQGRIEEISERVQKGIKEEMFLLKEKINAMELSTKVTLDKISYLLGNQS